MNPRNRTAAVLALISAGWTYEEVAKILDYPPPFNLDSLKQNLSPQGDSWPNLPPPNFANRFKPSSKQASK